MCDSTPSKHSSEPIFRSREIDGLPVEPDLSEPPTQEAIAMRAYELYVRSGRQAGLCDQHWQQAERELREENQKAFDEQDTVYQEAPVIQHDELKREEQQSADLLVWSRGGRHVKYRDAQLSRRVN